MKIYIKYMVSNRCKMVVISALENLGLMHGKVDLGEVNVNATLTEEQHERLAKILAKSGLELMDDKKAILVEKIKNIIVEMVHYSEEIPSSNFSDFLVDQMEFNYTYLANLFSQTTGITIEHFMIIQKVERIKELLLYDELNITEISYKMNYSSVAHLSSQFKKITGLTPSYFKKIRQFRKRIALEDL